MKLPATLRRMFGREEQRDITSVPWDAGGPVRRGRVSPEQALSLVPVFAAVRLLATQVASLPLQTYRRTGDGRVKLPAGSLFTSPSVQGTLYDWLHRCVTSLALRGNAYGLITARDNMGYPTMIEWLHPDDVWVEDLALSGPGSFVNPIWYWQGRVVPSEQMVHIPWFSVPYRVRGLSPMEACATAVSMGVEAQDYTVTWFANGAVPPGTFQNTQKIVDQKQSDEIKARLRRAIRSREPLVYGADWDYKPIAVSAHEAKFIETLKLTATNVANIYGVPPDMVGGDAGASGLTYRNEANGSLDFVKFTLRSWLEPLEEKLSTLLPRSQYVKFNLDALLRADLPARMQAYVQARQIGLFSIDEIRALEELPPLPDGKGRDYTPLLSAGKLPTTGATPGLPDATPPLRSRPPRAPVSGGPVGLDGARQLEAMFDPEPVRGTTAVLALMAKRTDPLDPAAPADDRRNFNPNEPRRPDGKWGSGLGGIADKLKLAERIQLQPGEHFAGSAKADDHWGDVSAVMARVDGPNGPTLRLGLVHPEDARRWRAANKGGTVVLSQRDVEELRGAISKAAQRGRDSVAEYNAQVKQAHKAGLPRSDWPDPATDIAGGTLATPWGDLRWSLTRDEGDDALDLDGESYPGAGWAFQLNGPGGGDSYSIETPGELRRFGQALSGLMGDRHPVAGA